MNPVRVGPATYVGYLLSALAAGGTVLAAVERELAGPGKWLAMISAGTAIFTNLGRQWQAGKAQGAPETAATPDGAAPAPPPGI